MIEEVKVDSTFVRAMEEFRKPNKEVGLLQACSENVVVFASHMLGLKLYSWQVLFLNRIQKALVDDKITREFLAITSRQIGKSTSIAIFALWCCVFNKYPGTVSNNSSIGIASASDEQAKKLLNEIKKFIRLGDAFMKVTYVDDEGNLTDKKEYKFIDQFTPQAIQKIISDVDSGAIQLHQFIVDLFQEQLNVKSNA